MSLLEFAIMAWALTLVWHWALLFKTAREPYALEPEPEREVDIPLPAKQWNGYL